MTAEDVICGGGNGRSATFYRYLIEAYAAGESFPHDIADLIDSTLNGATWTDAPHVVDFYRVRPFSASGDIDGREYRRSGGVYELIWRG